MRNFLLTTAALRLGALAAALAVVAPVTAGAAGNGPEIAHQKWSFAGVLGHFDQGQLQRGYQVYKEVCATCHGLKQLSFRNLGQPGGPAFSEEVVKTLAAEVQIPEINDQGKTVMRPGKPSDRLPSPFKNEQEARSIHNGAYPPDLSVMAKARSVHAALPWYMEPLKWAKEIVTGYQEGGPDYLHALMTGYGEPPKGLKNADGTPFKLADGMNYNRAFDGYQIAMPPPLVDGQVKYTDGTKGTIDQYSRDVTAFMMWAAEPHLDQRKRVGFQVLLFLAVTALLLWLAKRRLWATVEH
jgi:cytochrome c1